MKKIFVSLLVIFFSSISYSQSTFVGLVLEEIDNGGAVPGTTYRLYAELSGGLVYAVYANEANPLLIESTEDFYQDGFGGDLQSDLNSAFFMMAPTMQYDTWLTIGDAYFGQGDAVSTTPGFSAFASGSSVSLGGVPLSDDSWYKFTNDPNCQPDGNGLVLLGQFTTTGTLSGYINLQGMTDTPDNDGVGWTETNIPIPVIVPGCTDPLYVEYDALATEDDGSCATLIVNGCTDSDYLEYDASANTDDGSCATLIVNGCTDSDYLEYDASANTDDGSCATLIVNGCTDSDYLEYNASANTDDGSCITLIVNGCIDNTACNYNDQANTDNDSCVYATGCDTCSGETDGTGTVINNDADHDELAGCQDATACNFNALATDSDGLCIYTIDTCDTCGGNPLDGTGVVVNNDADGDGVCDADEVAGCQDATACNYNASATNDDSSCVFTVDVCDTCSGETDGTGVVVNNDADGDGICDADEVAGCQDATACNYNENATDDNGSWILPVGCDTCSGETDGTGVVVNNDADGDGVCDADEVAGCQDATACNYNENATDDDGSCILPVGCDTCSGETDGTGVDSK